MFHTVICGLPASTLFCRMISQTAQFTKKGKAIQKAGIGIL
jgi:hypothetical protein